LAALSVSFSALVFGSSSPAAAVARPFRPPVCACFSAFASATSDAAAGLASFFSATALFGSAAAAALAPAAAAASAVGEGSSCV